MLKRLQWLIRSTLAMTSFVIWRSWSLVFHPTSCGPKKLRTNLEALTKPRLGAGLRFMKGDWHLNVEIKWVPRAIKCIKPTNLWYIKKKIDTTTSSQKSPEWIGEWITSLLPWDWTHQSTSSWLFSMVLPHSDKGQSWWASRVPSYHYIMSIVVAAILFVLVKTSFRTPWWSSPNFLWLNLKLLWLMVTCPLLAPGPVPWSATKKTEWRIRRDIEEWGGSVAICGLGRVNINVITYPIKCSIHISYIYIYIHYTCIIVCNNNINIYIYIHNNLYIYIYEQCDANQHNISTI